MTDAPGEEDLPPPPDLDQLSVFASRGSWEPSSDSRWRVTSPAVWLALTGVHHVSLVAGLFLIRTEWKGPNGSTRWGARLTLTQLTYEAAAWFVKYAPQLAAPVLERIGARADLDLLAAEEEVRERDAVVRELAALKMDLLQRATEEVSTDYPRPIPSDS